MKRSPELEHAMQEVARFVHPLDIEECAMMEVSKFRSCGLNILDYNLLEGLDPQTLEIKFYWSKKVEKRNGS